MKVRARPCTVGLTGGLASGKSTVARMLAERGAAVLDADRVVHELYRPGEEGALAVAGLFGSEVLHPSGEVNRAVLAERVSRDAGNRRRLEEVIHPLVRERVRAWLEELAAGPGGPAVAVVEAALLVETGSFRSYDLLVVVWCPPRQQLRRAVARGMPEARARALLEAQLPLREKVRLADIVVDNSGPPEALAAEVDRAWGEILHRCGGGTIPR